MTRALPTPFSIVSSLDMTPMIDVVFQLLIFFVMTFRILAPETEFLLKTPLRELSTGTRDQAIPPLRLEVTANAAGRRQSIALNGEPLPNYEAVTRKLLTLREAIPPGSLSAFARETELEIACSDSLKYSDAIRALECVTGVRNRDGTTTRLLEKVRFAALE